MWCGTTEGGDEVGLPADVLHDRWRTETSELTTDQHGVVLVVLQHEDANLFHVIVLVMLGIVSVGSRELSE
jgi:hypothetical protein